MLSKLKYYLLLGVKKPNLILSFIYKKHIGLIISIPIISVNIPENNFNMKITKSDNITEITNFYRGMGRDSINKSIVERWLNKKFFCFLVYENDTAIGGMWVFKETFTLNNTSGRTLSQNQKIRLNKEYIYGGNVIINEEYRGKGINQALLNHVIKHFSKHSNYKELIVITGATNGAYIRSTMKASGVLIGITQVINLIGFKFRKELFLDKKKKVWI